MILCNSAKGLLTCLNPRLQWESSTIMQNKSLSRTLKDSCSTQKSWSIMGWVYTKQPEGNNEKKTRKRHSQKGPVNNKGPKQLAWISSSRWKQDKTFWILGKPHPFVNFGSNKQVITTLGQHVLCNPPRDDTNILAPCNHEEADTRIMVHVADAVQRGLTTVLLQTVDTDAVVIAIAVSQTLSISELWIAFCAGKNLRFLPIHEIASGLGAEKLKALPMFLLSQTVMQSHLFLVKARKQHGKYGSHITRLHSLFTFCLTDQKT